MQPSIRRCKNSPCRTTKMHNFLGFKPPNGVLIFQAVRAWMRKNINRIGTVIFSSVERLSELLIELSVEVKKWKSIRLGRKRRKNATPKLTNFAGEDRKSLFHRLFPKTAQNLNFFSSNRKGRNVFFGIPTWIQSLLLRKEYFQLSPVLIVF